LQIFSDIDQMAPNMKAEAAFEGVSERLKDSGKEFEEAKGKARDAVAAFNKVKAERSKVFNKAFVSIDTALKVIYKDLTKSSKHPLGGNAYLSLDDSDEPYLGGLKYAAASARAKRAQRRCLRRANTENLSAAEASCFAGGLSGGDPRLTMRSVAHALMCSPPC
jgi:hypothetical protein